MSKARPNSVSYASTGVGSAANLGVVLLDRMAGIQMLHVPYKAGSAATSDVMAGIVNHAARCTVGGVTGTGQGRQGQGAGRDGQKSAWPNCLDVPTVAETLPGYELSGWQGIWAPAGTPAPIIQRLNAALVRAVMAKPGGPPSSSPTSATSRHRSSTPDQMAQAGSQGNRRSGPRSSRKPASSRNEARAQIIPFFLFFPISLELSFMDKPVITPPRRIVTGHNAAGPLDHPAGRPRADHLAARPFAERADVRPLGDSRNFRPTTSGDKDTSLRPVKLSPPDRRRDLPRG